MILLKASLLASLSLANSNVGHGNPYFPSLLTEYRPLGWLFIRQETAARTEPSAPLRWNPKTASYSFETGVSVYGLELSLGHKSEHDFTGYAHYPAQSFDYMRASIEWKGE